MQKTPRDIIILHKCTKHNDPMLYCSWDMASDRLDVIVVFHFALFFPFYPSNSTKNQKIFKKWKKHLEISLFYTNVSKIMIVCYTAPEIWYVMNLIIFNFGLFLPS